MNIYQYLKGTTGLSLVLGCLDQKLEGFMDAMHADNIDSKSMSGYVFLFSGSPILWSCKKQSLVAPSSTITEYLVYNPAIKEGLWLRHLITTLDLTDDSPILLNTDSSNTLQIVMNNTYTLTTKWLDLHYHFI